MTIDSLDRHIEITPGIVGGKPRVTGRRISVQDIAIWHERLGRGVDEICADHNLSLAEVHAALAYYFDHRAEIDKRIAEDAEFVDALRRKTPSAVARKIAEGGDD